MSREKIEKIEKAVKDSKKIENADKKLILEKLQEWRHEKEAINFIPEKLAEISKSINPILDELGLI